MDLKNIIYTDAITGKVVQVIPAKKASLEKKRGSLSQEEYEHIVRSKLIPPNALNVREVDEEDLPDRDFFNAWINIPGQKKIGIDAAKAKQILLDKHALEVKELSKKIADKELVGDDATAEKSLRDVLVAKRNAIKAIDVSKVDHKKDLNANNAKLEELRGALDA